MTYQSIIDLLRNTAFFVNPSGVFMNARRTDGSLEYPNTFPQIHLYPLRETVDINTSNVTAEVLLMFWQQDSPESTNEQREAIIAQMDALSTNFLLLLNAEDGVNISNARKTPEFRQLAGTVSGYGLAFTLSGKISCFPDPLFLGTESGNVFITEFENVILIE
jgi:hypothetical protein